MDEDSQTVFLVLCEELAEKGSVEHQLFLGRHYFKTAKHLQDVAENREDSENSDDDDSDEPQGAGKDGEGAVKWLLLAGNNGSVEADTFLHRCLAENIGVSTKTASTIKDYFDVERKNKRHVKRNAAKKIFEKVKLTPDKPTVTKDEFVEVIKSSVTLDSGDEKMVDRLAKRLEKEKVSTEDEFVNVVKSHMKTSSPLYVDTEQYEQTPLKDKITKYPLKTAEVLGVRLLEGAANNGTKWLRSFVPYRQIQVMVAFCIYSIVSLKAILFAVPLLLFYGAFIVMVITSLQVVYGKQKIRDLKNWAKILHHFDTGVDENLEKTKKTMKIITPFLWTYFISFFIAVVSFSFSNTSYIACPECCVFACLMTVAMLVSSRDNMNVLVILSMLLHIFITLPHILHGFPRIPILYHAILALTTPLVQFSLLPGFSLNISFPAVAYVAIPLVFTSLARQKSGKGMLFILAPHLICITWWHAAVMFYRSSMWLGLLRATVGWSTAILLFPVTSVLVAGSVVTVFVKLFSWSTLIKCVTTICLVALPVLFSMWYKTDKRLRKLQTKYKILIVITLAVAALISSLSVVQDQPRDRHKMMFSWKHYNKFCGPKAVRRSNTAELQIRCGNLEGTLVSWSAIVTDVKVSSVDNVILNVLNVLPDLMAEQLKCIYGEAFKTCTNSSKTFTSTSHDSDDEDDDDDDNDGDDVKINKTTTTKTNDLACRYTNFFFSRCHVDNYNVYRFIISANVAESTQSFQLHVSHRFKKLALALRPGNRLKVEGRLSKGLGTSSPAINVQQIQCTNCLRTVVDLGSSPDVNLEKEPETSLVKRTVQSFGFVFNFFLSPLISFEIETNQ